MTAAPHLIADQAAPIAPVRTSSRWVKGLHPDRPLDEAARHVLTARLEDLQRRLSTASKELDSPGRIRQVRVGARRAIVALRLFAPCLDRRTALKLRRRINRLRRRAGHVRNTDVFLSLVGGLRQRAPAPRRQAVEFIARALARSRQRRAERLGDAIDDYGPRIERHSRALLDSISCPDHAAHHAPGNGHAHPPTLRDAARDRFFTLIREARDAADGDLESPDHLHELRLATKHVRYAVEVFESCLGERVTGPLYDGLIEVQDRLGAVADIAELAEQLRRYGRRLIGPRGGQPDRAVIDGLADLLTRYNAILASRRTDAASFVRDRAAPLLVAVEQAAGEALGVPTAISRTLPRPRGAGKPRERHPTELVRIIPAPRTPGGQSHRMAVIDIGTNSVRCEIVEAYPDRTFRILDDEKETTRLGSGILRTGVLAPDAMERTIAAVSRMAAIAAGYHVEPQWVRAIGTFAVRTAANRDDFLRRIRERTGLDPVVLSSEQEGKLAFLSAKRAIDLAGGNAAVVDVGGGSTEIVLSPSRVPEQIYGLPLGAMLLTEEFGGPLECAGDRFREMRRAIDGILCREVGRPLLRPQLIVGTGGTFSVLAAALAAASGRDGPRLWDRRAGFEATRSDIAHLLDRLRRLTPGERAEVPGIPADRADIVVAGFTVIDRILRHIGANAVIVHDRGIRDGMIHAMVAAAFPDGTPDAGPMGAVRRLANKCNYEQPHSEHVTSLALSIHDHLAAILGAGGETPAPWATSESRRLLEAAGVLHDIGYLVSYTAHHKHSYHLIVHDDLAAPELFSPREVELIALIARYHRRAEPRRAHPGFGTLSHEDRDLVRRLAGILRIADGLDRTHTRAVGAVSLSLSPGLITFTVEPAQPGADLDPDLWGAAAKKSLFERAFRHEVALRVRVENLNLNS